MNALLELPVTWVTLTWLLYAGGQRLYARTSLSLLHPVLVAIAGTIGVLSLLEVEFETYDRGGRLITFFLGPAVVALGIPLYTRIRELGRQGLVMGFTVLAGALVGILAAVLPLIWLGAPEVTWLSMSPKSVTTPIAIAVSEGVGGEPSLTASFVVMTGILGAMIGPFVLRRAGVRDPVAFGLAMGSAAHGIGTARTLEEGRTQGAASSLGICLNGLLTALLVPPIVQALLALGR